MIKIDDARFTPKQGAAQMIKKLISDIDPTDDYFDVKPNGKSVLSNKEVDLIDGHFEKYRQKILKMIRLKD